nr:MAG TPA: hypothetical protein [Caudoviricetes sp.]
MKTEAPAEEGQHSRRRPLTKTVRRRVITEEHST